MIKIVASNYAYVELLNSTVRKFEEDFPFVGEQCRVVYAAKFTKVSSSGLWGKSYSDGRVVLDVVRIEPDQLRHVVVHELFHQVQFWLGTWCGPGPTELRFGRSAEWLVPDLPKEVLKLISPVASNVFEGYTELLAIGYLGIADPDSQVFRAAESVLGIFTTMCGQI